MIADCRIETRCRATSSGQPEVRQAERAVGEDGERVLIRTVYACGCVSAEIAHFRLIMIVDVLVFD